MNIISDNDIDEDLAKQFLSATYDGINLLPQVPERLTENLVAAILNVSEPTIKRMKEDKQIELTKSSILSYIRGNFLACRPLDMTSSANKTTPNSPISPQMTP